MTALLSVPKTFIQYKEKRPSIYSVFFIKTLISIQNDNLISGLPLKGDKIQENGLGNFESEFKIITEGLGRLTGGICKAHILNSLNVLVGKLKTLEDERFIVYGFNKNEVDGNLTYKEFNEDEFYDDLASSKAVICNGGFTFISEAIHLKKPIYSVPAIGNFEQTLNGFYVQKLGYGEYHEVMSASKVRAFLNKLPKYQERLAKVKKTNNDGIVRELIYRIEKYSKY